MFQGLLLGYRESINLILDASGLVLLVTPLLLGLIFLLYLPFYSKHMDINSNTIKKLHPKNLFIIFITIYTLVIVPFSFYRIYTLNNEINQLEFQVRKLDIYDYYDDFDFTCVPDEIEYAYQNYYTFFGGHFTTEELGTCTLLITEDAPQELIAYLENHDVLYMKVKYSYNELHTMMSELATMMMDDNVFSSFHFDFEHNCFDVELNVDTYDLSHYQYYIDEGTITVYYGVDYEFH